MTLVPVPRRLGRVWSAIVLAAAALILISAFIPVQHTVSGFCLMDPAASWTLKVVREGCYESKAVDLASGRILAYRLYQFDRPAFLDLDLSRVADGAQNGNPVRAGMTVARMQASSLSIDLAERSTALQMAKGRLASLRGGAKPEEIEHAQIALERARAAREGFKPLYERQSRLHEEGAVDDLLWDETRAQMNLLEMDVSLAQAEMRVLASDDRPAYIAEAEITITALEQELQAVENMLSAQEIQTPIAGVLRPGTDGVTLLSVSGLDMMIAQILLPQRLAHLAEAGQRFKIYIPGIEASAPSGTVLRVDRRTTATEAGGYVSVFGSLDNTAGLLEEGMQGRARIYCGEVTLLSRVWRDIVRAVRQEIWPA